MRIIVWKRTVCDALREIYKTLIQSMLREKVEEKSASYEKLAFRFDNFVAKHLRIGHATGEHARSSWETADKH